jgi:hypothetical protein
MALLAACKDADEGIGKQAVYRCIPSLIGPRK